MGFIVFLSGPFLKKPGWVFWVVFFYNNPGANEQVGWRGARLARRSTVGSEFQSWQPAWKMFCDEA